MPPSPLNVKTDKKFQKFTMSPISDIREVWIDICVCMYVFVSFLMIKTDVFVSALKIDGYNKNKVLKNHNKKLHY